VRFSYKSDYFNDPWQGIPMDGYAPLFERMLAHRNIDLCLSTDFFAIRHLVPPECRIIYTGPVDRFFDYRFGRLGWLTLEFEKQVCPTGDFQGTAVMNYADSLVPYTRIHEFRHYHDERAYPPDKTVVFREYSQTLAAEADPYYPLDTFRDRELLGCYENECMKTRNVIFGGRLGAYKYLDMDKAVACALETFEEKLKIIN
jgi:UDP-galactopyranose mutase